MSDDLVAVDARTVTRLASFVRRAMMVLLAEEVTLVAMERRGESMLARVSLKGGDVEPDDIARELAYVVETDPGDAPRYMVRAIRDGAEVSAQTIPRKLAPKGAAASALTPDAARDVWVTALVRQNQDMFRLMLTSAAAREESILGTVERLTARNSELESVSIEHAKALFELARGQRILDAEAEQARAKAALMADTVDMVKRTVPRMLDGMERYLTTRSGVKAVESVAKLLAKIPVDKLPMLRQAGILDDEGMAELESAYEALADFHKQSEDKRH